MTHYRTDRDRKIQGNRVVARQEMFIELGDAVAEMHGRFAAVNSKLLELLGVDPTETAEEETQADEAENRVVKLYNWAYHQLAAVLAPNWEAFVSDERVTAVREHLFPMGSPSMLRASSQLVLDGVNHLMSALKRESVVKYPETFVQELAIARESLVLTLAALQREEEREVSPEHAELRGRWDDHYLALRDVTTAFLRLDSRLAELDAYFAPEPFEVPAEIAAAEVADQAATDSPAEQPTA
jgi:hypothetical protein